MIDLSDGNQRVTTAARVKDEINHYAAHKKPPRWSTRLSPSALGGACAAALWYDWRWATEPQPRDGRMARYNELGDVQEGRVIEWLRATGWEVVELDPDTGDQIAVKDFDGHLYGKTDGLGRHPIHTNNEWVLLEFKYVNMKRFSVLTGKALKVVDLKYYGQICLYMMYLNLNFCFWMPGNRNDDDIQPIIIPRDDGYARELISKGGHIMHSPVRPARIAESPAFYYCKNMCDHQGVCHLGRAPARNCRSCLNCVPTNGGKFHCNKWNAVIPNKEAILAACPEYDPIK